MARVMLSIGIAGWSVRELKQAIVDLDVADSGTGEAIAYENVTAEHVFEALMNGDLGVSYTVLLQTMRD